jgi:hypothetical protein
MLDAIEHDLGDHVRYMIVQTIASLPYFTLKRINRLPSVFHFTFAAALASLREVANSISHCNE